MDHAPLVEMQINDGRRLIDALIEHQFDVGMAAWLHPVDRDDWYLHIASTAVDPIGLRAAYGEVIRAIKSLEDPWITPSDVKLLRSDHPTALAIKRIQEKYPLQIATRYGGSRLGEMSINEAYFYPLPQISAD